MVHPNYTKHRKDYETLQDYFTVLNSLDSLPKYICEFGVDNGGSLLLWNDMFSPKKIIGFDSSPQKYYARKIKMPVIDVYAFDQRDQQSLKQAHRTLKRLLGTNKIDLFIDDCSHDANATQNTLSLFWDLLRQDGLYIIEDWRANNDLAALAMEKEKSGKGKIYHSMVVLQKV